ncbi:hypothetical protein MMYC01_208828 [Madurella mycetomatis]|uniref:Extracellular protein n=1 Tax=Madurella mycetomatis TaxID=100816 RepID=A0A175VRG2_9PEZI|nr:hypothetical protein MMYC01_208828 [Madurella mycetomatis]
MKASHILSTMALAVCSSGHMTMTYPAPLKSKYNPNSGYDVDYSITSPLSADGSNYPCKGYLSLLGTSQGKSVASWDAGGSYNFTISGGASHNGGSCQAALSVDGGKTFHVVHSYEGGCPGSSESSFNFRVPNDVPATEGAIFAWTWFNNLGNREMYMNCAVVDIIGRSGGNVESVPFASRPSVFKANLGNGCTTVESKDLKFPRPGPDVDSNGNVVPPVGNCGAAASPSTGGDDGASSGSGSGSSSGSGGSAGNDGVGHGGTSSGNHPGERPSPTSASPRLQDCQTVHQPTAISSTASEDAQRGPGSWTPGNDWPEWFQSAASLTSSSMTLVLSVCAALIFGCHILQAA